MTIVAEMDAGLDPIAAPTHLNLEGSWERVAVPAARPQDLSGAAWQTMALPANWHLAGLPDHTGVVLKFMSDEFARRAHVPLQSCGSYQLEGVGQPMEVSRFS